MNRSQDFFKQHKYLFITSDYLPNPDANGLCVSMVAEELIKRGHKVYCIAYQEEELASYEVIEKQNIYRIPRSFYGRIRSKYKDSSRIGLRFLLGLIAFFRKLKGICILPFFPSVSLLRERKIYRLSKKMIEVNQIDLVVGVFRPFEGIGAAIRLKKKYPNLKICAYFLDLLHCSKPTGISENTYQKLCKRKLLPILQKINIAIFPVSGKKEFEKPYYDSIKNKLVYTEFPLVRKIKAQELHLFSHGSGQIHFVYAGTISKQGRDPTYMLLLFSQLRKNNRHLFLHIFGSSSDPGFKEFCETQDGVTYYGCVKNHIAYSALEEANIAINLSNQESQMVPSKIFELFSFGKPIINFVKKEDDLALPYMKQYPYICNVYEYKNQLRHEKEKLQNFISELPKMRKLQFETVKKIYKDCTPEHVGGLFSSL